MCVLSIENKSQSLLMLFPSPTAWIQQDPFRENSSVKVLFLWSC